MKDDCNKLTYCKKIGVKKISECKYEKRLLLEARTGLNLCDASVICSYYDKVILSKYENLQKYGADPLSQHSINPLSANPTKWSNTLKQFVGNFPTNCLSVFDHFVGLALKELRLTVSKILQIFIHANLT